MVDEPSRPSTSGRLIRPDAVGLAPRLIWKYWLRNTVPPNRPIPTNRLATVDSVMVRSANSRSGMIGSATRCSTAMNSAPSASEPPTIM